MVKIRQFPADSKEAKQRSLFLATLFFKTTKNVGQTDQQIQSSLPKICFGSPRQILVHPKWVGFPSAKINLCAIGKYFEWVKNCFILKKTYFEKQILL